MQSSKTASKAWGGWGEEEEGFGERKGKGGERRKRRVGREGWGGWEGEEGAGRQKIGAWIVKGGTARGSGRVGRGRGGVGSKREKKEECEA